MPDPSGGSVHRRNQLQLTVLSGEILKRQLDTDHEISLSCNISELQIITATLFSNQSNRI